MNFKTKCVVCILYFLTNSCFEIMKVDIIFPKLCKATGSLEANISVLDGYCNSRDHVQFLEKFYKLQKDINEKIQVLAFTSTHLATLSLSTNKFIVLENLSRNKGHGYRVTTRELTAPYVLSSPKMVGDCHCRRKQRCRL